MEVEEEVVEGGTMQGLVVVLGQSVRLLWVSVPEIWG